MATYKQAKRNMIIVSFIPLLMLLAAVLGLPFFAWLTVVAVCMTYVSAVAYAGRDKSKTLVPWICALGLYVIALVMGVDFLVEVFAPNQGVLQFLGDGSHFLLNGQALYWYYVLVPVLVVGADYIMIKQYSVAQKA